MASLISNGQTNLSSHSLFISLVSTFQALSSRLSPHFPKHIWLSLISLSLSVSLLFNLSPHSSLPQTLATTTSSSSVISHHRTASLSLGQHGLSLSLASQSQLLGIGSSSLISLIFYFDFEIWSFVQNFKSFKTQIFIFIVLLI